MKSVRRGLCSNLVSKDDTVDNREGDFDQRFFAFSSNAKTEPTGLLSGLTWYVSCCPLDSTDPLPYLYLLHLSRPTR